VGGQRHAPATLPPGRIRYPLYRRLGGPQGRSGRVRKISSHRGFNPRTFKTVESRYTYWVIRPTISVLRAIYCCRLAVRKDFMNSETLRLVFTGVIDTARIQGVPVCFSRCLVVQKTAAVRLGPRILKVNDGTMPPECCSWWSSHESR
jgi:hypothetical protein